jgi:hypothetical protein
MTMEGPAEKPDGPSISIIGKVSGFVAEPYNNVFDLLLALLIGSSKCTNNARNSWAFVCELKFIPPVPEVMFGNIPPISTVFSTV